MEVPYNETTKPDLSDYPFFPNCSENVFEQQKHSHLPRKRAIAMQQANKKAADAAVAAINGMASGGDIKKNLPFIDAFSANKIANNKPVTWHYLDGVLMQRQLSRLLAKYKVQLKENPQPVASKF